MSRRLKFMVIGAQKAGTTWLHTNLSYHPEVVFPPLKEFFFFNEIDAAIPTGLWGRKVNNHWLNIKWKQVFRHHLLQAIYQGNLRQAGWFIRYLLVPRRLNTKYLLRYDRLFPASPGKVSGDITPNYSVLSERTVAAIAKFYPDAKVLFILRNPVERSWSQAKMNLGLLKGRDINTVSDEEIRKYLLSNDSNEQLSDYRTTLQRWTACYPKEQLFIGFYDDLVKDPSTFYRSVLAFLGLSDVYDEKQLTQIVYKGAPLPMPLKFEQILSAKYQEQLAYLTNYFSDHAVNYPQRWLEQAERVLQQEAHR